MQLNNLVALMGSLMVDLGINKKMKPGQKHDVLADEINCELTEAIGINKGLSTMEEGRAVLGCFYMSSIVSPLELNLFYPKSPLPQLPRLIHFLIYSLAYRSCIVF